MLSPPLPRLHLLSSPRSLPPQPLRLLPSPTGPPVRTYGKQWSGSSFASRARAFSLIFHSSCPSQDNFYAAIGTMLFVGIGVSFLILLYVKSQFEGNVSGGFNRNYFEKKEGSPSAVEAKKKGKR